jgi:hypothetical protein
MSVADTCVKNALRPELQEAERFTGGPLQRKEIMSEKDELDFLYDDLFVDKHDGLTRIEWSRFGALKREFIEKYGTPEDFYVQRRRWEKGWEPADKSYEEFKKLERKISVAQREAEKKGEEHESK